MTIKAYLYILRYTLVYMEETKITTIKISKDTKSLLDEFKVHQRQSYEEVIRKIIEDSKNE